MKKINHVTTIISSLFILALFILATPCFASDRAQLNDRAVLVADLEVIQKAVMQEIPTAYGLTCKEPRVTAICADTIISNYSCLIKTVSQKCHDGASKKALKVKSRYLNFDNSIERLKRMVFVAKKDFSELDSWNRIESFRGERLIKSARLTIQSLGYICEAETKKEVCESPYGHPAVTPIGMWPTPVGTSPSGMKSRISCEIITRQKCSKLESSFTLKTVSSAYALYREKYRNMHNKTLTDLVFKK